MRLKQLKRNDVELSDEGSLRARAVNDYVVNSFFNVETLAKANVELILLDVE